METKYTPGPWGYTGEWVICPDGNTIADVHCRPSTDYADENEANGRLIAAAPDLLTALEAALKILTRTPNTREIWIQARAAIDKAVNP